MAAEDERLVKDWPPEKWYCSPALMEKQLKAVEELVQCYREVLSLMPLLGFVSNEEGKWIVDDQRIAFQSSTKNSQAINTIIRRLISRLTRAQRELRKIQSVPVPEVLNPQPGLLVVPYDPVHLKACDQARKKPGAEKSIYRRQKEQMPNLSPAQLADHFYPQAKGKARQEHRKAFEKVGANIRYQTKRSKRN